jgi:hypothetical protein
MERSFFSSILQLGFKSRLMEAPSRPSPLLLYGLTPPRHGHVTATGEKKGNMTTSSSVVMLRWNARLVLDTDMELLLGDMGIHRLIVAQADGASEAGGGACTDMRGALPGHHSCGCGHVLWSCGWLKRVSFGGCSCAHIWSWMCSSRHGGVTERKNHASVVTVVTPMSVTFILSTSSRYAFPR